MVGIIWKSNIKKTTDLVLRRDLRRLAFEDESPTGLLGGHSRVLQQQGQR
jgi:hypothetical protein